MPWKASSVMEEKLRFICEYDLREQTMSELCQKYGIARETGYVWLRRYRAYGLAGLLEHSHAAHRHANQTPEEIERMVLELRQAHMRWGPRKLKRILQRDEPGRTWPAASTIGALLKREGLVVARKKRWHTAPYTQPLAHADEANRVWWMKLCIMTERIEAGHPKQNGRHERMHRTLKQEVAQPPAANRRQQQEELDRFRQEYNEVRPHEALEMRTPAAVYQASPRKFPVRVPEPDYPATMLIRSVRRQGHFRWKKHDVFLSEVLWGEQVGLLPEDDRWFTIYFAQLPLARFDSQICR